jgi:hypothetical protein
MTQKEQMFRLNLDMADYDVLEWKWGLPGVIVDEADVEKAMKDAEVPCQKMSYGDGRWVVMPLLPFTSTEPAEQVDDSWCACGNKKAKNHTACRRCKKLEKQAELNGQAELLRADAQREKNQMAMAEPNTELLKALDEVAELTKDIHPKHPTHSDHFSHRNNTPIASLKNMVLGTEGFTVITETPNTLLYIGKGQPFLFYAEHRADHWTYHYRIPLDLLLG